LFAASGIATDRLGSKSISVTACIFVRPLGLSADCRGAVYMSANGLKGIDCDADPERLLLTFYEDAISFSVWDSRPHRRSVER
jgi:hypothetical protein